MKDREGSVTQNIDQIFDYKHNGEKVFKSFVDMFSVVNIILRDMS
jgi:hypothetical protein